MGKLRAFIFGTVMHPYWGYQQGRNYTSINNILKVTNFLKNSRFTLFGIHAKDTNFTFGTPYTHMYTDTHRHAYIQTQMQIPFSHFVLFGSFLHIHRHSDRVSTETLTHRYRYTETQACLYTYTNTHTNVHVGNLRKLLLEVYFLKSKLVKIVTLKWNLSKLLLESHFKLKLAKIVTLNGKLLLEIHF